MNKFLVVVLMLSVLIGTLLWEKDRPLKIEGEQVSVDTVIAERTVRSGAVRSRPRQQVLPQAGHANVAKDDHSTAVVHNPNQVVETLGFERGKRLPNGAFETPNIDVVRSMHEELRSSSLGDRAPESWSAFMTQMEHGAVLVEELNDLAKQEQLRAEVEETDLRANGSPEEIQLWERRQEMNGVRLEILAGLNQGIADRTAEYNKSRPIEEWVNGSLPASLATPEELALRHALREDQLENLDSWNLISNYLLEERGKAVTVLENGDPTDPIWWADRIDWIDKAVDKIGVDQ